MICSLVVITLTINLAFLKMPKNSESKLKECKNEKSFWIQGQSYQVLEKHIDGDNYYTVYYNDWEGDSISSSSQFRFYDTIQTGKHVRCYDNGIVEQIMHFKNGFLDGAFQSYDSSGIVLAEGKFVQNAKIGQWKYYYPNGKLAKSGTYMDEMFLYKPQIYIGVDSIAIFVKNGKIVNQVDFTTMMLRKYGKTKGEQIREFPFCEYMKHGEWSFWDKNGAFIRKEFWNKGIFINEELETK